MHTGNFKVVKIISFGVHRPSPLARQAFWRERLAGRRDDVNLNKSAMNLWSASSVMMRLLECIIPARTLGRRA